MKGFIAYYKDCIELIQKHKRFLIKFTVMITALYAAMAAIAVYWDQICEFITNFRSGKVSLKWNPGRLGKFVTYDDDDTTGGLDADEADE